MAKFEYSGFDDEGNIPLTGSIECPSCGKQFDISLDTNNPSVICPHCQTEIEIELS